ncbi:MAG: hypothetical protein Q8R40_05860 [bacterium]|nr:hypothetical protein [bacterium]
MSIKNLSRTVIEGGRRGWSKYERRHFTQQERTASRVFLHRLAYDLDLWDERVMPLRQRAYKEFADKLSPAYRWLHSRVGKNWDMSRAILFRKFDTRTTARCHIIFSRLLKEVKSLTEQHDWRTPEYMVDADGMLTHTPRPTHRGYQLPLKSYEPEVSKWLNSRRMIQHGTILYWLVPTGTITKIPDAPFVISRISFRQDKRFCAKDETYFYSLSSKARKELLDMRLHSG